MERALHPGSDNLGVWTMSSARTVSTPNIIMQRSLFEDAGFRGFRGKMNHDDEIAVPHPEFSTRTATQPHGTRKSVARVHDTSLDCTPQEATLLRKLSRLKELRSGVNKAAGTQWTPRGQHRPARALKGAHSVDIGSDIEELLRRTQRLEAVVHDKVGRRESWLHLWDDELTGLGWERSPQEGKRRSLYTHAGQAGPIEHPAMPPIVRLDGSWSRGLHEKLQGVRSTDDAAAEGATQTTTELRAAHMRELGGRDRIEQKTRGLASRGSTGSGGGRRQLLHSRGSSRSVASRSSEQRRHPQHASMGRDPNAGLSVPFAASSSYGRHERNAYSRALTGVMDCDKLERKHLALLRSRNEPRGGLMLVDTRAGM
jgi:hypothetical protein